MNERVPDSSGLPLRAMVMVLLFFGVIFLLIGFQAMRSSGSSDNNSSTTGTTITSTTAPAAAKADVRVYDVSSAGDAASRTADRLKQAGFNVTDTGSLTLPDVTQTTVFFSDAAGEQQAAEQVGQLLQAPVQPRVPALADQQPGVIVAVTG